MEKSIADEIAQVSVGKPHVVLLEAGASRAAFPNGERAGRRLLVMADFLEIVPVGSILSDSRIPFEGKNFEEIYSDLAGQSGNSAVCAALEAAIFEYFSSLALPETQHFMIIYYLASDLKT